MKTVSISVAILLSLLLLANFSYAADEYQSGQGADMAKNGEEAQEKKLKFPQHIPPFYQKPFLKSFPKKPIPHYPLFKKPFPKPHYPPVFPSHP